MAEQLPKSSKRARGACSRLICLECHERRIKCELPDEVPVPDPGELRTTSSPCYRCKKLGVPCVVRRTRLGRSGLGDGSTALATESQDETHSTPLLDPRLLPVPRCMNPAKIQILPLRRATIPPELPVTSEETSSSSDGRLITAKRTRASKPKVKTGCLTCKIRRVCHFLTSVTPSLILSLDQMRRSQTCLSEVQQYWA
jgi:hypothetical protein